MKITQVGALEAVSSLDSGQGTVPSLCAIAAFSTPARAAARGCRVMCNHKLIISLTPRKPDVGMSPKDGGTAEYLVSMEPNLGRLQGFVT